MKKAFDLGPSDRSDLTRPQDEICCRKFQRTYVMGILNVTPDSFSDGGLFFDKERAVEHARKMAADGADIIDVGGESTRPGAAPVGIDEELDRVIPVIEAVSGSVDTAISIDTRNAKVAEEAIKAGAAIVNDVSGLRHDPQTAAIAARHNAAFIVMHMRGTPQDMQDAPHYDDLIGEIKASLRKSADIAKRAGVREDKIIIDPGIGFGKTVEHNLEILNRLGEFKVLGYPICIGTSRKSFIGKVLNKKDAAGRLLGTIATSVIAVVRGAKIIRVHDVREAVEAVTITDSVLREKVI